MSKKIELIYDDTEYVLEYTRNTVQQMESKGFVAADVVKKPVTILPELFAGAFLAHHRGVKRKVIDEIFDLTTNRGDLVGKLAEMYNAPINALMEDPEDDQGNVTWGASW